MEDLYVTDAVTIPDAELRFSFVRSRGPGGQNVNKVASKVELRWAPGSSMALSDRDRDWLLARLGDRLITTGELVVTCESTKSQTQNRILARKKLADLIRAALVRPKKRKRTRPSRAAIERRITAKKQRGERKQSRRNPARDEGN